MMIIYNNSSQHLYVILKTIHLPQCAKLYYLTAAQNTEKYIKKYMSRKEIPQPIKAFKKASFKILSYTSKTASFPYLQDNTIFTQHIAFKAVQNTTKKGCVLYIQVRGTNV